MADTLTIHNDTDEPVALTVFAAGHTERPGHYHGWAVVGPLWMSFTHLRNPPLPILRQWWRRAGRRWRGTRIGAVRAAWREEVWGVTVGVAEWWRMQREWTRDAAWPQRYALAEVRGPETVRIPIRGEDPDA